MRNALLLVTSVLTIATGCGSASTALENGGIGSAGASTLGGAGATGLGTSGAGQGSAGANSGSAGTGSGTAEQGLPCEVGALLQKYCVTCHSNPPIAGVPHALLTYADLQAMAASVPTSKVGALAVTRMADGTMPPKPLPGPTAAEQATYKAWVDAGMPMTACGTGGPVDPYATPVQCSSGATWKGGDRGSPLMHPGGACISCHSSGGDGPIYGVAGTVFPSAHEPNDCNGASSASAGALSVVITEANGTKHTLPVNSVGNFFYEGTIGKPYLAEVSAGMAVRAMVHSQSSGDCNGCHTVSGGTNTPGADPAPGRIMAP